MSARVTLKFNHAEVRAKISAGADAALAPLSEQVLKDSNFYARQDTGAMIASSLTHSDPAKGEIVWATPYAKRVYYTGTPSHDVNPNATLMWYETAKRAYLTDWLKLAQKIFSSKL